MLAAERTTPLSLALQILGAAAGLTALVTLVGGAMLWIRFDKLDLPADRAVSMLPRELLVTVGAHSLLGPLIAGLLLAGAVMVLQPLDRDGHVRLRFWIVGLPALGVIALVVLVFQISGMETSYALLAILAAFLALGAIAGTAWRGTRARFIAWTAFAACVAFGAVLGIARTLDSPRMEPVGVLTGDDTESVAGFFVGETDDRLYVVQVPGNDDAGHPLGDARADRLLIIPRDDVKRIAMTEPVGLGTDDPGRDRARTLLGDLRTAGKAVPATSPVSSSDPVTDFAPLVHIASDEDWMPTSAEDFIDHAILKWSNRPHCPSEVLGSGKDVRDKTFGELDPKFMGAGEDGYRRGPDAPDCDPDTDHPVSFFALELTRPYAAKGRSPRLPIEQGFYLDVLDGARGGSRSVEKEGPQKVLRDVPVYVDRSDEDVDGSHGLRLTYWLFYAFSEPPGPRGLTRLVSHEGDWERISVLLRRGREPDTYVPVSVRYFFHNERRDVPWSVVNTASAATAQPTPPTHPVVYSARGSHASFWRAGEYESVFDRGGRRHFAVDDVAIACPDCPVWRTWELIRDVREEPWYGFGGAWGKVGGSGDTTGPLGPSRFKR